MPAAFDEASGLYLDESMPGFGVRDNHKHGYMPVRIRTTLSGEVWHEDLGNDMLARTGHISYERAWKHIQRKYFPKALRMRKERTPSK